MKKVVGCWLLGALCLVVGAGVAQAAEITVTVPTVEWTTLEVKTNGTTVAGFAGGQLIVPSGTVVTVDYTATDDLTIDGNSQFTATVSSDMQLPTDADKPVVTKQVSYMARGVDENGCVRFVKSHVKAIPLSGNTKTLGNGWYFVHRSFSCEGIDVLEKCTANLILSDGTSLTTKGPAHDAGIDVRDRETLNIYGQEQGTGALTAESLNGAGIGGGSWVSCGTVNIYGGKVTAKAGNQGAGIGGGRGGSGGKVNIYGGTVTATSSGEGAGIGGGREGSGAAVTINGGTVTVRCYGYSGIGGGSYGSGGSVKITGGTVRVEGNYAFGENVSLGEYAYAYDITKGEPGERITSALTLEYTAKILVVYVGPTCNDGEIAKGNGGVWFVTPNAGVKEVAVAKLPSGAIVAVPPTVTKVSGVKDGQIRVYDGAENITSLFTIAGGVITRQTVVVTVGELSHLHLTAAWTSGDGSETNAVADGFFVVPKGEKGVKVIFTPEKDYAIFGSPVVELGRVYDDTAFGPESGYLLPRVLASIPYLDWDAENRRMTNAVVMVADCEFVTSGTQKLSSRKWNVVLDEVKVNNGHLAVPESESARLILADGMSLTVTPSDVDDYQPGILVKSGSTLSIYAQSANKDTMGRLSAVGTDRAAGIGGAYIGSTNPGDCGTVNIYGGRVTATGGDYAAGIGGGGRSLLDGGAGGNVSICGGIVTAWGENGGAAIGGGNRADGGTVTIYGGEVIADNSKGESEGAGIGGGYDGAGGTITILGGKVTATGGKKGRGGAGIGGGDRGSGGTITISGGIVMATGGASGAGIGGGGDGAGCALTVSGGVTEAQNGIFTTSRTVGEDMEVTGEFNKAAYIKISDKNPTCEGGSIAPGEGGVWVVTPDIGVATVTLGNLSAGATFVVPPSVTKVIGVDDKQILVYDGDTDVTSQYLIHGGIISPLKTFDDGSHYVESSGEAYVDTGYVPTVDTRIVADFHSMARSEIWSVFFGVTKSDSAGDGVLLRYTKNDDMSLNAWFCGSSDMITGFDGKRLTAELKTGSITLDGTDYAFATSGTPYNGPIYIFCGNNGGKVWRPQAMRLYSFRIYEGDTLVRDFVPLRTTDGTAVAGLYDRVTEKPFANAGGGSLTLEADPICEGGSIAEGKIGVWTVTPDADVTAVKITDLPNGGVVAVPPTVTKVEGVPDGQIMVVDGGKDVTRNFAISDGSVVRQIWTVTVGKLEYLTAAWTSDDGVTNAIEGESFDVPVTATGVKVIFTPDEGYDLAGESVFEFRTLTSDIFFGPESGYLVPKAGICYLDWDEGRKQLTDALLKPADCTFMTSEMTELSDGGWYVVRGAIVIGNGHNIKVSGSAHLILCDGSSLTVRSVASDNAAIDVTGASNALTIYGQENGSGTLTVTGGRDGTGIGGGKKGTCGKVTINGGTVTATGASFAAGIGGGYRGSGGIVTINGGTVTANGGDDAAGIGGGYRTSGSEGESGTVTINGGRVTAIGGPTDNDLTNGGKGIGSGATAGRSGSIKITGGTVEAEGWWGMGFLDARIDGGSVKASSNANPPAFTIMNPPTNSQETPVYCVTVEVGDVGDGEKLKVDGLGSYGVEDIYPIDGKLYLYLPNGDYRFAVNGKWFDAKVNEAETTATPSPLYKVSFNFGAHITSVTYTVDGGEKVMKGGTFTIDGLLSGTKISYSVECDEGYKYFGATELTVGTKDETVELTAERTADLTNVAYCDEGGVADKVTTVKRIYPHMENRTIGDGNWYAIDADTTVGTLTVNGTANLILVDGTTLTVTGGVRVTEGNALNIYAQSAGTGALIANGADGSAGIGGGKGKDGEWLIGNYEGIIDSAIGAAAASCGWVTIYGGMVTANGSDGGAGIGGGRGGNGGVSSNCNLALDPGHSQHHATDVWDMTLINASFGCAGGTGGAGGTVTILNGTVCANGKGGGVGIGGGAGGRGGPARDQNGNVGNGGSRPSLLNTTGGDGGDGGAGGAGGTVIVRGGTVTANGDKTGAGIGGGKGGAGGSAAGTVNYYGQPSKAGKGGDQGADNVSQVSLDAKVEVVEGGIGNDYPSVKIAEKPGPTCTGGTITPGEGGEWVVTPEGNATEVEIAGLPAGATVVVPPTVTKVTGAEDGKIRVRARVADGEGAVVTHDITDAFTITDGTLALNPEGAVNGVKVKPVIGELESGEPFTLGEGDAAVTVATIPGLVYELKLTTDLGTAFGTIRDGVKATGDGKPVKLTDTDPPKVRAFYIIDVSAP